MDTQKTTLTPILVDLFVKINVKTLFVQDLIFAHALRDSKSMVKTTTVSLSALMSVSTPSVLLLNSVLVCQDMK